MEINQLVRRAVAALKKFEKSSRWVGVCGVDKVIRFLKHFSDLKYCSIHMYKLRGD